MTTKGDKWQGAPRLIPMGKAAPPSSAEVKNEWSYTSTPPTYAFMTWIRKN